MDGVIKRVVTRPVGNPLFLSSSLVDTSIMNNIHFGPMGSKGATGAMSPIGVASDSVPPTQQNGPGQQGQLYIDTTSKTLYKFDINAGAVVSTLAVSYKFMDCTTDSSGNVYTASWDQGVAMVDPSGNITQVVPAGTYDGDGGPAIDARAALAQGITRDNLGNIYFTEFSQYTVRMIDTNGNISTIAGIKGSGGWNQFNGPALSTQLYTPAGITCDNNGNIYFSEISSHLVRRLYKDGSDVWQIETIAGSSSYGYVDGVGTAAVFNAPWGVTLDGSGNLFVLDNYNNAIRKIVLATKVVTTIARPGGTGYLSGTGTDVPLNIGPYSHMGYDGSGNLFFGEWSQGRLWKFNLATGRAIIFSGSLGMGSTNGPASIARLTNIIGVCFRNNTMYCGDWTNGSIRKIDLESGPDWVVKMDFASGSGLGATLSSAAPYTPANPSDWASPAPTTITAALDRIAAALSLSIGFAIP